MKYRYREMVYRANSIPLISMEPGDEWCVTGIVRFHLPAVLIHLEEHPEWFHIDLLPIAPYVEEAEERVTEEDDENISEPLVAVEYGPDEWHVIDGWGRILAAQEMGREMLPAVKLPASQAMGYLVVESDVRRYIEYWNFRAAYWERRDRINGFLNEDRPEYHEILADGEATWEAIMASVTEEIIDVPLRWNRWFGVHREGEKLLIGAPAHMSPVCLLTFDRKVRKAEFLQLFPLFEQWTKSKDEEPVREAATKITISYEYIFALIRYWAAEKTKPTESP